MASSGGRKWTSKVRKCGMEWFPTSQLIIQYSGPDDSFTMIHCTYMLSDLAGDEHMPQPSQPETCASQNNNDIADILKAACASQSNAIADILKAACISYPCPALWSNVNPVLSKRKREFSIDLFSVSLQ
jgi:hypothetical protein